MAGPYVQEVKELSDIKARQLLPAIVYIALMMTVGTISNSFVCYYYGFKVKRSPHSMFIIVLAVYDLLACLLTMPTEIADILLFYSFDNDLACKSLRFFNYFIALASGTTLIVIAVERFRMICLPTKPAMTTSQAMGACLAFGGVSLLLSWPALLLYGAAPVHLVYSPALNVTGHDCTLISNQQNKVYNLAFNGVHLVVFISASAILISLYTMVCRKLRQLRRRSTGTIKVDSVKFTMIMLTVTSVFIVSFLPYLFLKVWITLEGKKKEELFNDQETVAYKIGAHSYMLNNVANPLIYGFFNSDFRAFVFRTFRLSRKRKDRNSTSSRTPRGQTSNSTSAASTIGDTRV